MRSDDAVVASVPASESACVEDALFRGIVEGCFPNDGAMPEFEITPEWGEASAPSATGLVLSHPAAPPRRYATDAFAVQARHVIRSLRAAQRIDPEAHAEWHLIARRGDAKPAPRARVVRAPFPLLHQPLPECAEGAFAVDVESRVLDTLQRAAVAAGATECAALLLGEILHDPARRAVLVRVRGDVPLEADRGGASGNHFALGPRSLLRARREARRRADHLVPVGWAHSHPPCAECPAQPGCRAETVFFSAQDEEVHAAAFAAPFMVALVVGKLGHLPALRPGFRLFVWEAGRVVPAPFAVSGSGAEAFRAEARPIPTSTSSSTQEA